MQLTFSETQRDTVHPITHLKLVQSGHSRAPNSNTDHAGKFICETYYTILKS